MNDNRAGGMLLVGGSLAGMITMVLHPVAPHGGGLPDPHAMAMLASLDRIVHALALTGIAMIFLGALALTQRLAAANRLAVTAQVLYGFAAAAIMVAGAMSGFVGADLLSKMAAGDLQLDMYRMLLNYTFRINQAFASIYAVGSCAAIFLWSLAMLRDQRPAVGLGRYGLILSPVIVAALFSGYLKLNVHGAGLVMLVQAIWFIVAGGMLMRVAETPAAFDNGRASGSSADT